MFRETRLAHLHQENCANRYQVSYDSPTCQGRKALEPFIITLPQRGLGLPPITCQPAAALEITKRSGESL